MIFQMSFLQSMKRRKLTGTIAHIFTKCVMLIFLFVVLAPDSFCQSENSRFLVCGDYAVHVVDLEKSRDSIPHVIWTWDAQRATDIPKNMRGKFRTVDDCKSVRNGSAILISSSSGAIALVEMKTKKVLFLASVPNAHSIELLPGDLVAAAASTAPDGNKIMIFDLARPEAPVFTDSLYSAHGVYWDKKRKSLFALGYDVLRAYTLHPGGQLELSHQWKLPGTGGHDLQPSPDGNMLFITEHRGAWAFDLAGAAFRKIPGFPDAHHIKSLGQNSSGQYIFTVPEESWWTFHVTFSNPGRELAFPHMKVYKARWFNRPL